MTRQLRLITVVAMMFSLTAKTADAWPASAKTSYAMLMLTSDSVLIVEPIAIRDASRADAISVPDRYDGRLRCVTTSFYVVAVVKGERPALWAVRTTRFT